MKNQTKEPIKVNLNSNKLHTLLGANFTTRGERYLVIGIGKTERMLLLKYDEHYKPREYVVAFSPYTGKDGIDWDTSINFPIPNRYDYEFLDYDPIAEALREANALLMEEVVYVCIEEDSDWQGTCGYCELGNLGTRCVGVFTKKADAIDAVERMLNENKFVQSSAHRMGKDRLSFEEYKTLCAYSQCAIKYQIETISLNRDIY